MQAIRSKYHFNNQRSAMPCIHLFFSFIIFFFLFCVGERSAFSYHTLINTIFILHNSKHKRSNLLAKCIECVVVLFRFVDMFMSLKIETHSIYWLCWSSSSVYERMCLVRASECARNLLRKVLQLRPGILFAFIFYVHQLKSQQERSITNTKLPLCALNVYNVHCLRFQSDFFLRSLIYFSLHSLTHSVSIVVLLWLISFFLPLIFRLNSLFALIATTRYLNDTINYFTQICELARVRWNSVLCLRGKYNNECNKRKTYNTSERYAHTNTLTLIEKFVIRNNNDKLICFGNKKFNRKTSCGSQKQK